MHHCSAGEINRMDARILVGHTAHESVHSPHHVSEWEVNHEHPKPNEQQNGGEFDALGNGPDDQRRGNDGWYIE